MVLAPVVKGRKGHYREDFQKIAKLGFTKVRVDGEILDITPKMQVDRYKIHDIEIVIDRLLVKEEDRFRLSGSVQNALTHGKGTMLVLDPDAKKAKPQFFSRFLMDPATGIAYDDPAPKHVQLQLALRRLPHLQRPGRGAGNHGGSGVARPQAEHQPGRHRAAGRVPRHLDFPAAPAHSQEEQGHPEYAPR